MPPVRGTGDLWNHFSVVDGNKAKCSYCFLCLSVPNGDVSSLKTHLERKHPTVHLSRMSNTAVSNVASVSNVAAMSNVAAVVPMRATNVSRETLRSKEIDKQIIRMIVKEYHPFNIVEGIAFRKLLSLACPSYTPPTRKTISSTLIPRSFNELSLNVAFFVEQAAAVCLTTESWSSQTNENFMSVTAHFVDKNSVLRSVLLECIVLYERDTSEDLVHHLQGITHKWKINNKISAIVSDGAPNIVAAIREFNWRYIDCFAHSLNSILQSGLTHIGAILTKVRAVVQHFKKYLTAMARLHSIQEQLELPKLKLIEDVPTRWNSTYDMISRFITLKDALVATIGLLEANLNTLLPNEWNVLEKASEILEFFNDITEEISTEKNVPLSKVIVLVNLLTTHLESYAQRIDNPEEIQKLIEELQISMTTRFQDIENNDLFTQATLLDPRFKKYSFLDEDKHTKALDQLKKKVDDVWLPQTQQTVDVNEVEEHDIEQERRPKRNVWMTWDSVVEMHLSSQNNPATSITEVDKYMNEPLAERKDDPIEWWKKRRYLYPHLFKLIERRLCIQAASVPCDRIFTKAGELINKKRSALKPSKVPQILFLNQNL